MKTLSATPSNTQDQSIVHSNRNPSQLSKFLFLAPTLLSQISYVAASADTSLRGVAENSSSSSPLNNATTGTPYPSGKLDCPCIPIHATGIPDSPIFDEDKECLYMREPGQTFCYPTNYGFEGCQAYDKDLPPSCNQEGFPGNPDWCVKSFCYVDPDNCKNTDHFPSTYFKEEGLHYSYSTCGSKNTFIGMVNDQLGSFMELAAALERYVVGFRFTLENGYETIKEFSENPNSVAKECSYSDSCDPVLEGSYQNCWGTEIDFNNVNVVLHPQRSLHSSEEDINTLACLSHSIRSSFLNVADAEHDDSNRVGYLYYGDQDTGGLVLYPEQPFCSKTYDARFRPWYASAVSGPKDVVVVVDTSGSMKGERIGLAKQAANAVIDTLTWADRVSLVTFTDAVNRDDLYSQTLVESSEENIEKMRRWIDAHFEANGGTNFMNPLNAAYDLLKNNQDANDQKSCSQAILFLTDGHADFNIDQMQRMVDSNPNAVVFSYGLSDAAQQDALQQMACMTGGIYHPVRNEVELPSMMSSYYEYYAKLQDNGKLSWLKYTDAITGDDIVSGCTPIFNYGKSDFIEPDLIGVTCMDLNIIIDLKTLESCRDNAYDQFIEQIFREATRCSSTKSKVDDECVLQNMRARIGPDSVCAGQSDPDQCRVGPQVTETNFTNLNPERFEVIPLNSCDRLNSTCEDPRDTPPKSGASTNSWAASAAVAAVAAAGSIAWS